MAPGRRDTDAQLIATAGRDPAAFGELFDRYAARIDRWARRAGLSEADALELVSELFARVWVGRRRYRDPGDGSAGPWLYGIARNLLSAHRREGRIDARARRRLGMQSRADGEPEETVDARLDASASRPALERALQALPAGQRDAVRLRVVDGLEYSEIARRLSCTETAARKRVSLGLQFLRSEMETVR
jgi:RNA polymerase sigma factor (sigma-70 family)